ncbi:GIY-YIG nuclease family protein [Burkholderia orbicola]|uniref:GIY-YIG nuclease family protein n=1 Tax=Burkholderia orbicola TaxID=2978683 RepID=A0ABT8P244_9BURK|nr:GIY-YIG nuclease family protein [Burkholderia orbicola]MDN7527704.1 GIY-YIG nuclease family protein [Burkholderia orbicola]
MSAFVYVLMHRDGDRFKIGKAVNLSARIRQLSLPRFRPLGSFALEFDTERRAIEVERILHLTFQMWRCKTREIESIDRLGEGASEFFSSGCYNHLVNFIKSSLDLFNGRLIDNLADVFNGSAKATYLCDTKSLYLAACERAALACCATLDGPIKSAFECLNDVCTISNCASTWLFIWKPKHDDATGKAFSVLDNANIVIPGTRSKYVRRRWKPIPDGDYHRCFLEARNSDSEESNIISNLRRRFMDILECRHRVAAESQRRLHYKYWSDYMDHLAGILAIDHATARLASEGKAWAPVAVASGQMECYDIRV